MYGRILIAGLPNSGVARFFRPDAVRENQAARTYFQTLIRDPDLTFDLFGTEASVDYDFMLDVSSAGLPAGVLLATSDQSDTWDDLAHLLQVFRDNHVPVVIANTGSSEPTAMLMALNLAPDEAWITCVCSHPDSRTAAIMAAINASEKLHRIPNIEDRIRKLRG